MTGWCSRRGLLSNSPTNRRKTNRFLRIIPGSRLVLDQLYYDEYYYCTCTRQENTWQQSSLIVKSFSYVSAKNEKKQRT